MDADDFRTAVEDAKATELTRLGSSQLLVALTDAELDAPSVLTAAGASERAARGTFRSWAADESNDRAREAFDAVADQEDRHLARVREAADDLGVELDLDGDDAAGPGPMHAYLRGREDAVERVAGGMVGRTLVSLRTHAQLINFFVNEADERRADVFRDLREDTRDVLGDGLVLLDELCDDEGDRERARAVAEYTIGLAYDDYADALRGLGLDPKMVC
jgi:hypothetical protein